MTKIQLIACRFQLPPQLFSKDYICLCHVCLQYKLLTEVFCLLVANAFQVYSFQMNRVVAFYNIDFVFSEIGCFFILTRNNVWLKMQHSLKKAFAEYMF